jgi:hypothetical protein
VGRLTIFLDEHSHVVTHKGAHIQQDCRGGVGTEAEGDLLSCHVVDRPPIPRYRPARPWVVRQAVPRTMVARHVARGIIAWDVARLVAWHRPA